MDTGHAFVISDHPTPWDTQWGGVVRSRLRCYPATRANHAANFRFTEIHHAPTIAAVRSRFAAYSDLRRVVVAGPRRERPRVCANGAPGQEWQHYDGYRPEAGRPKRPTGPFAPHGRPRHA